MASTIKAMASPCSPSTVTSTSSQTAIGTLVAGSDIA